MMESHPFDFTRIGINLGIRAAATTDLTGYSEHCLSWPDLTGVSWSPEAICIGRLLPETQNAKQWKWPTRAAAPMVQSTCMMLQPGDDSGDGKFACHHFL
uniref:Uncharacterized protein n=1 Tax=Bionectria ochroleuca TaxID=29856 RepID=A0A8H7NJP7_BIOOC